jgi:hypothetical protein
MPTSAPPKDNPVTAGGWFPVVAGCFLGLALVKFGNPVILDVGVLYPPLKNLDEVVSEPWPVNWGYGLMVLLAVGGWFAARRPAGVPPWVLWMPAAWLAWLCLSAAQTVDAGLTRLTMPHFAACVACFYLGLFAVGTRESGLRMLRAGLVAGLLAVLVAGMRQHHGGFESNLRFFRENEATGWTNVPPEQVRQLESTKLLICKADGTPTINPAMEHKLTSVRIFGTLVYPNALAGVILLLLPLAVVAVRDWTLRLSNVARGVLIGSVAYLGVACLYWSGSKAGWLVALAVGVVALLRLPFPRAAKVGLVAALLVGGSAGLVFKYRDYFSRGAKSAVARFDYWEAAWSNSVRRPVLGSGPGTFYSIYKTSKRPESEMARLAHNDYLQQASDSGWPALAAFAALVLGTLGVLWPKCAADDVRFAAWLGLAAWAMQAFVEFGLYIPASGWTLFLLLGALWSDCTRNGFDTPTPAR